MKIQAAALSAVLLACAHAFLVPQTSFVFRRIHHSLKAHQNEFDFILHENGYDNSLFQTRTRRVITSSAKKAQLMSSVAASVEDDSEEGYLVGDEETSTSLSQTASDQEYSDSKLLQYQEQQGTNKFNKWLSQADFQEIVWTLFVPSLLLFAGLRFGYQKLSLRLADRAEDGLESFANEMIFHDGNFDEMQLCKQDWDGRLAWLGPAKKKRMLNTYLEDYAKRKPVSPQAISSISYVFTLFGMSEEKAADALVSLCRAGGAQKISSANKMLFFGSKIFKSPEALAKLKDIKDLIKSTYRSTAGADAIVETSQYAMGESAYRAVLQKTGRANQLPDGWQVLGLTKARAMELYQEEKESGFKTAQEEIYGGQTTKYNAKGQRLDENGYPIEEAGNEGKISDDESEKGAGVYECGNCGYTLFVAEGRGSKFFGSSFKCPECGADKDQFKTPEDME